MVVKGKYYDVGSFHSVSCEATAVFVSESMTEPTEDGKGVIARPLQNIGEVIVCHYVLSFQYDHFAQNQLKTKYREWMIAVNLEPISK